MIKVDLTTRIRVNALSKQGPTEKARLAKTARLLLKGEGLKQAAVGVVVLGQGEISQLNKKYLSKNHAANVLSFPAKAAGWPREGQEKNWLGEVVLCPAVIKKEARKLAIAWEEHFAFCFIHGLLHLLGYSDRDKKSAAKMGRQEQKYLNQLI